MEIDNEEGGVIHLWNVHAYSFRIVSNCKLHSGSWEDAAYR